MVDCDKTELKRDAKYWYYRIEDQAYLQKLLEPKLPVAPAAVAAPPEDAAAPVVAGNADAPVQPPTPSADGAAGTKVSSSSPPATAPSKSPVVKNGVVGPNPRTRGVRHLNQRCFIPTQLV